MCSGLRLLGKLTAVSAQVDMVEAHQCNPQRALIVSSVAGEPSAMRLVGIRWIVQTE